MTERVEIELQPLGVRILVRRGTSLREALHAHGVEFPCGGDGLCGGCRVRLRAGELPADEADEAVLDHFEIEQGWRLACRARAQGPLTLEIEQWETPILGDNSTLSVKPRAGRALVIDLGTTTLVAQLVDLESGEVKAVESSRNPQAAHGADIMSRIAFALDEAGRTTLVQTIRARLRELVTALLEQSDGNAPLECVLLVGNTVMHHLFFDLDPAPLAAAPFESPHLGPQACRASELGWALPGDPPVRFLPCLGGFVGADVLAGVLASGMHESNEVAALIDLGTNGEIALGNRERILCTSTAAGPAFEGGCIGCGMQAATGAISEVHVEAGGLACSVIGGGRARGLCGSGLVDAVAGALDLGWIEPGGRIALPSRTIELADGVCLQQADVRQLQLAKAAIAAGTKILSERLGVEGEITRLHLAGAFGNYVRIPSARRIGLFDLDPARVEPAGNSALRGVKCALFGNRGGRDEDDYAFEALRARIEHVALATDRQFQDVFVRETTFPS